MDVIHSGLEAAVASAKEQVQSLRLELERAEQSLAQAEQALSDYEDACNAADREHPMMEPDYDYEGEQLLRYAKG